jgi:hypothetical protein
MAQMTPYYASLNNDESGIKSSLITIKTLCLSVSVVNYVFLLFFLRLKPLRLRVKNSIFWF